MLIYHYTLIDTLALILKNKTIRFNRLDCVDDIEEVSPGSHGIKLGLYSFVSCWTRNDEENIALWKMYSNMKGVRITFEDNLFNRHATPKYELNGDIVTQNLPILNKEESIINNYLILVWKDKNDFLFDIEYVNNPSELMKDTILANENGGTNFHFDKIGKYKHNRWSFQAESRFKVIALPALIPNTKNFKDYWAGFNEHLFNNIPPNINYIDMKISDTAFNNMTITLSPLATYSDELIVCALVNQYCPTARVKKSSLNGCIRK